jgi:guanylate kinase
MRNGVLQQEQDGVDYHFWSRAHFEDQIRAGAFLEWADVYGYYYGTLRREVEPFRRQGQGVILEIDVQGADQVRQQCPDTVSIFLKTSSWKAYEERLRGRGTEDEAAVQRRLAAARRELERAGEYDFQVSNDNLEAAVAQVHAIVTDQFERNSHAG